MANNNTTTSSKSAYATSNTTSIFNDGRKGEETSDAPSNIFNGGKYSFGNTNNMSGGGIFGGGLFGGGAFGTVVPPSVHCRLTVKEKSDAYQFKFRFSTDHQGQEVASVRLSFNGYHAKITVEYDSVTLYENILIPGDVNPSTSTISAYGVMNEVIVTMKKDPCLMKDIRIIEIC